jgi:hypothetical protein
MLCVQKKKKAKKAEQKKKVTLVYAAKTSLLPSQPAKQRTEQNTRPELEVDEERDKTGGRRTREGGKRKKKKLHPHSRLVGRLVSLFSLSRQARHLVWVIVIHLPKTSATPVQRK